MFFVDWTLLNTVLFWEIHFVCKICFFLISNIAFWISLSLLLESAFGSVFGFYFIFLNRKYLEIFKFFCCLFTLNRKKAVTEILIFIGVGGEEWKYMSDHKHSKSLPQCLCLLKGSNISARDKDLSVIFHFDFSTLCNSHDTPFSVLLR